MTMDQRDSTRTELQAVFQGLLEMGHDMEGHTVLHRTDSMATYFGLANGGYAVEEHSCLNVLVRTIWALAALAGIRLVTEYVGSDAIIRSGADLLSRVLIDDRTCLREDEYRGLLKYFHWSHGLPEPHMDLMAEPGHSRGEMQFYSLLGRTAPAVYTQPSRARRGLRQIEEVPDLCVGRDALAEDWTRGGCVGVVYVYPPLHLVEPTVEKALREVRRHDGRLQVLLIVPRWTHRHWWPLLHGFPYKDIGTLPAVTYLPVGARRPIESEETWKNTTLRAFLLRKK